jgi:hypothetical protein
MRVTTLNDEDKVEQWSGLLKKVSVTCYAFGHAPPGSVAESRWPYLTRCNMHGHTLGTFWLFCLFLKRLAHVKSGASVSLLYFCQIQGMLDPDSGN